MGILLKLDVDDRRERAREDLCSLVVEELELIRHDDTKILLVLEDLENFVERRRFEDCDSSERRP